MSAHVLTACPPRLQRWKGCHCSKMPNCASAQPGSCKVIFRARVTVLNVCTGQSDVPYDCLPLVTRAGHAACCTGRVVVDGVERNTCSNWQQLQSRRCDQSPPLQLRRPSAFAVLHTCERAHGNDFAQTSAGQRMLRHEARRRQGHKASALCGARPVQGGRFTYSSHTSVSTTDSNGERW